MKTILLLLSCVIFIKSIGQEVLQTRDKIKFASVNQVGLLSGELGESYTLQTINGISYKTWMVGAGIGIDKYSHRSIPVFLDIRKDLSKKNKAPFVYADGGVNYTWITEMEQQQKGLNWPGLFFDAGIGFKVRSKGGVDFLMSAGYSYKHAIEYIQQWQWISPWTLPGQSEQDGWERWDRKFRRIVVKVGIQI